MFQGRHSDIKCQKRQAIALTKVAGFFFLTINFIYRSNAQVRKGLLFENALNSTSKNVTNHSQSRSLQAPSAHSVLKERKVSTA